LILLEELELKYNFNTVDIMNCEQKSEEFLTMQPFGKVPVVKYGDKTIFESRSIMRYIARANQDIEDFYGDYRVDMWLEAEAQNYNAHVETIVGEKMFKKWKNEEVDQNALDKAVLEFEKVLDVYEKHMEGKKYIAGDEYSIADMSHIPYTYYFLKCGYKDIVKKRPNVYNWLKRIIKREAVRKVLEGELEQ
jgi:glutathione S-transferase